MNEMALTYKVISRFHPPSLRPPPIRNASKAMSRHFMSAGASSSTIFSNDSGVRGLGSEWGGERGWIMCKYGRSGWMTASSENR